ncbi:MAG: Caffeyl-CoA reductase-Etf complex subunit CarD [Verrucomicrobia subdivision 3 bacterium]|nr:Caffeyl-CoA reductase-Etf complex subunit CarD [Limisphaerales bacterium]MCS1413912.1 Caffeyl-CoA reductase-Etf complex subunit CarD [Limisphaerales bacterium]
MKILVCLKQILDPEIPARDFRVRSDEKAADLAGANLVTNIFCENALETALQFCDQIGEGEVTVLSLGGDSVEDMLRKALAMGADHAMRLDWPDALPADSSLTAKVLAAGIQKLGRFDAIFVGRESGDWGMGQTGAYLAEILEFPLVSFVDEVKREGDGLLLRRQSDDGWERFRVPLPVAITITNSDDNLPRIPKTRDIMKSSQIPIRTLSLADLGLSAEELHSENAVTQVVDLFVPNDSVACEFVDGDSFDEKVDRFADRIAEIVKRV